MTFKKKDVIQQFQEGIFTIALLLICSIGISACEVNEERPTRGSDSEQDERVIDVIEGYVGAIDEGNREDALKYLEPRIRQLESVQQMISENEGAFANIRIGEITYQYDEILQENVRASVGFSVHERTGTIDLVKVKGEWYLTTILLSFY